MTEPTIRDAATIILLRDAETDPKVLMGQRGATAAFMPNKFVFPGGAVDPGDTKIPLAASISQPCTDRLANDSISVNALAAAAIRELWEEAGLILGTPGDWDGAVPDDWIGFSQTGHVPSPAGLHFIFRAITPPGRPRRFDARFFLADANFIANDLDDFSHAHDELSHLQWVSLKNVRNFDLPFITEVVLSEVAGTLPHLGAPASVPFFRNSDEDNLVWRLGGASPLK